MESSGNIDTGNRIASEILMAGGIRSALVNDNSIYAINFLEAYVVLRFHPQDDFDTCYTVQTKLTKQRELETSDPDEMLTNWKYWHSTTLDKVAKAREYHLSSSLNDNDSSVD
jgi:hypothetical protein